jgi:catechol 2,3-dioxygenase-like lactoylglutathione lyase family enzyme
VDWKLELVVVPVADQDVAKAFYLDKLGFELIVDHRAGTDFRVVQANPPGSACAVALMRNPDAAGSLQGLHLVVDDIDRARADLVGRGGSPGPLIHFVDGRQEEGPDPDRSDYNTFFELQDPDGNGWLVQEVGRRA